MLICNKRTLHRIKIKKQIITRQPRIMPVAGVFKIIYQSKDDIYLTSPLMLNVEQIL